MAVLIWSNLAVQHLKEICNYIAENNPAAAMGFGEKLVGKIELLESFPLMGQVFLTKYDQTYRALHYGRYRIIYRVINESTVYIYGIYHTAMDSNNYKL